MSSEPLLKQQFKNGGSQSSLHSVEAEKYYTPDSECQEDYQPQEIIQNQGKDEMQE